MNELYANTLRYSKRNFRDLQHLSPKFEFVPKSALTKYRNVSPNQFGVSNETLRLATCA